MSAPVIAQLSEAAAGTGAADADIARFAGHLGQLPPHEAARMNPFEFARGAGIRPETAVDLFVRGSRQGLFDLEWGMICPNCAALIQSVTSLDRVAEETMYCAFCATTVESVLDDTVEVSFSHPPSAGGLNLHEDFLAYRHYFTSGSHPLRDFFTEYQNRNRVAEIRLAPGEHALWNVPVGEDATYRVMCLDTHRAFDIRTGSTPETEPATVALGRDGFSLGALELPPGERDIAVSNNTDIPVWLHMVRMRVEEVMPVVARTAKTFGPRLTGKHLLANQTFRDSFALSDLAPDLKLKLRSLTLLFTDLKGSTALYDREGDLAAYRLVQDHFVALKDVVRGHSGAMVKTMGDAVMAAFPNGRDGVRAAVDMMAAMQAITGGRSDDVGLKVGLHSGPALAINAGQSVDYFGQTVNIAARVQGLADEGEICLSRALTEDDEVNAILSGAGYCGQSETARLKGVTADEQIMRYRL